MDVTDVDAVGGNCDGNALGDTLAIGLVYAEGKYVGYVLGAELGKDEGVKKGEALGVDDGNLEG